MVHDHGNSVSKVRILVADDHEIIRRGLRTLAQAQTGWEVCGEASTGPQAVAKVNELKPDVVVLDVSLPELNGIEAVKRILRAAPRTEVLVYTIHESDHLIRQVFGAGANSYVAKSDSPQDLVRAIQSLSQHRPFLTPKVGEALLSAYRNELARSRNQVHESKVLTSRESEILQLLAEGMTNKEIATHLNIHVRTVETHRNRIMTKLDMHSMSDLVRYAIREKIITL